MKKKKGHKKFICIGENHLVIVVREAADSSTFWPSNYKWTIMPQLPPSPRLPIALTLRLPNSFSFPAIFHLLSLWELRRYSTPAAPTTFSTNLTSSRHVPFAGKHSDATPISSCTGPFNFSSPELSPFVRLVLENSRIRLN